MLGLIRHGFVYSYEPLGMMVSSLTSVYFSVKRVLSSRPILLPMELLGERRMPIVFLMV